MQVESGGVEEKLNKKDVLLPEFKKWMQPYPAVAHHKRQCWTVTVSSGVLVLRAEPYPARALFSAPVFTAGGQADV